MKGPVCGVSYPSSHMAGFLLQGTWGPYNFCSEVGQNPQRA